MLVASLPEERKIQVCSNSLHKQRPGETSISPACPVPVPMQCRSPAFGLLLCLSSRNCSAAALGRKLGEVEQRSVLLQSREGVGSAQAVT